MSEIDLLLHRYLEDRDSLSERELTALIAALRADRELAHKLHDQLVLDDLLAQKLAIDRRNFVAQVEQRIADVNRGHGEVSRQTADLRSIAAAEKASTFTGVWRWTHLVMALSVLVAVGALAIATTRIFAPHPPAIAKVTALDGEVKIEEPGGDSEAAELDGSLENGQRIVVPRGGSIGLTYQDGTLLQVKNDAVVTIGSQKPEALKQVRVERGEVVAQVKPQAAGAMVFSTPHGKATAPAAYFRLVVTDEGTVVEVREGNVQLDRVGDKRTLPIAANESGMASRDTLQIRQLTWPDRRDGLAYLLSPLESTQKDNKPLTVVRNSDTRRLRITPLEPRGAATLLDSRVCYELNGGYLISGDAGPDIIKSSRGGSELTLEAVFSPASMDQSGPARIVSLSPESEEPDFALDQDGSDVMFCIMTDKKSTVKESPRMSINPADSPVHLTITYRNGELIAYRDGMEIARSTDFWGSLGPWQPGPLTVGADASGERTWRGIMEALALYNRCLEPGEVARNARNYRLLAGRGM
jgi:hypothetical protein